MIQIYHKAQKNTLLLGMVFEMLNNNEIAYKFVYKLERRQRITKFHNAQCEIYKDLKGTKIIHLQHT